MTVTGIEHDMVVMQALAPQAQQQILRDLTLGAKRQGFRYVRPVRLAQHVMKALIVATCHLFGHLFHVAPVALKQAMEVTFGGVFD